MASDRSLVPLLFSFLLSLSSSMAALLQQQPLLLHYHHGALLNGNVTVNVLWYGHFTPAKRAVLLDFLQSLSSTGAPSPSVASWWKTTGKYGGSSAPPTVIVGRQFLDEKCSLGKSLTDSDIVRLSGEGGHANGSVNAVFTASDVAVKSFCTNRCGTHGSALSGPARFVYAWIGNSELACPGYCAWPFHQPVYGPQAPPLVAPNGDVGVDGMVISLATVLAGAVTNPYGGGYFQGPAAAPLEAVTACAGVFGSGAYPGYAGSVLTDEGGGASYNANGVKGRRYLLPAMWDPLAERCATLV